MKVRRFDINSNYSTEEIIIPCINNISNKYMIVIPGNPGVIQFYETYIRCLSASVSHLYHIHGVSLAGHVLNESKLSSTCNLQDQVAHKILYLEDIARRNESAEFVLIGHSIGSYMCIEVMKRAKHLNITHHIGLFPFLEDELSLVQRLTFRSLFLLSPILASLVGVLGFLPLEIKRLLMEKAAGLSGNYLETGSQMFESSLLKNCLHLGQSEFNDLNKKADLNSLLPLSPKITLYFTDNDKWAPVAMFKRCQKKLPDAQIIFLKEFMHGFVVDRRQCSRMVPFTLAPLNLMRAKL